MNPLDRIRVIFGALAVAAMFGCNGEIPMVSPSVGYAWYPANPPPGQCVATCARPGSILTPQICHTTCSDYQGRLVYLPASTPGAGAILTSLAGPLGDVASQLAPVVPLR